MNEGARIRQAIELGRRAGEPAHIIPQTGSRGLTGWILNNQRKRPLADPRLEVIRALSSVLDKAPKTIDRALTDAMQQVGWKLADLQLFFPSFAWHRITAFMPAGEAA